MLRPATIIIMTMLIALSTLWGVSQNAPIPYQTSGGGQNIPGSITPMPEPSMSLGEDAQLGEQIYVILEPKDRAVISAEIASPVVRVFKLMGESFEEGDILMKLEDTIYKAAVLRGEALVVKGEALFNAKQQLFIDHISSLVELKDAEAQLASARAELALAQKQLRATTIRAPYRGKVVAVNLLPNELPQPGQPLIEILGDSVLVAKMLVDSMSLNDVKLGNKMDILIRETGQTVQAEIVRIGSVIDPASSTIKVDAEIDNSNRQLIAGMTGITTLTANKSLRVTPPGTSTGSDIDLTPKTDLEINRSNRGVKSK